MFEGGSGGIPPIIVALWPVFLGLIACIAIMIFNPEEK